MPGCGKSSIGKELSLLTDIDIFDTDSVIEKDAGMSIPDIFKQKGEEYFRNLETKALEKVLLNAPCIIACGGGIVLKEENRELLKHHNVFFIKRDIESLPKNGRPLSQKNDLSEMYKKRLPLYKACANFEIENIGIIETAQKIKDLLK